MVFKWELQIRKGYKSDIQIRELTKEHKADYLKMLEWQEKTTTQLNRLRKAYERERQDILKDFEKIVSRKRFTVMDNKLLRPIYSFAKTKIIFKWYVAIRKYYVSFVSSMKDVSFDDVKKFVNTMLVFKD